MIESCGTVAIEIQTKEGTRAAVIKRWCGQMALADVVIDDRFA